MNKIIRLYAYNISLWLVPGHCHFNFVRNIFSSFLIKRVKNSFNSYPIDRLAQQAAIASFGDEDYFQLSVDKVIASRTRLVSALEKLQFTCLPSAANFILIHHASIDASSLASFLRDRKIIVRYFSTPRIDQYIRITVGTDQQNQILLEAIAQFLAA